ncbi:hypothetical protein ACHAWF_005344 [Thalassiosira exigua]
MCGDLRVLALLLHNSQRCLLQQADHVERRVRQEGVFDEVHLVRVLHDDRVQGSCQEDSNRRRLRRSSGRLVVVLEQLACGIACKMEGRHPVGVLDIACAGIVARKALDDRGTRRASGGDVKRRSAQAVFLVNGLRVELDHLVQYGERDVETDAGVQQRHSVQAVALGDGLGDEPKPLVAREGRRFEFRPVSRFDQAEQEGKAGFDGGSHSDGVVLSLWFAMTETSLICLLEVSQMKNMVSAFVLA